LTAEEGSAKRPGMKRHPALVQLSRDHHQALVLGRALQADAPRRLRATLPADSADLVVHLKARFAAELEPHFAVEDRVLIPVSEAKGEPLALQALRIRHDHAALREMVASLAPGPRLGSALDAFGRRLMDHVQYEERIWFPTLEQELDTDALAAVAADLTGSVDGARD
jgi:iron-sulfur cluster repair protein YtfE (RIC family)